MKCDVVEDTLIDHGRAKSFQAPWGSGLVWAGLGFSGWFSGQLGFREIGLSRRGSFRYKPAPNSF